MQDNNLWHLSDNSDYSPLYEEIVYTVKDKFAITIFLHHNGIIGIYLFQFLPQFLYEFNLPTYPS